jgi:hypothetical protein
MREIDKQFETESETQHHAIIRYFLKYREGTIQDITEKCVVNWPHKRISDLEDRGVEIQRIDHVHRTPGQKTKRWRIYKCKTSYVKLKAINEAFESKKEHEISRVFSKVAIK